MKRIFRLSLVVVFTVCLAFSAEAQKFGYTNSQAILMEMPDVKRADAKLADLQKQLQKKGEQMLKAYQTKRADLQRRYDGGEISPAQANKELEALGQEEQKLMKYEQDMMTQLGQKREELIKPILQKVQDAIDAVAKEKGYKYVIDSSTGVLLYADPSNDITSSVKAKLGM
jgi:outer membrane protein